MLHGPCGELVGRRRRHRAALTAAERRPRRVPLVHEKDAHHVRVQHGADHVGETPELGVGIGGLRQGRAEGAEVADLEGERLRLLGEPVDTRRNPLGHRVERLREAADLVAALGRQLLPVIAPGDGGGRRGETGQRRADRPRHDQAHGERDDEREDEGGHGDHVDLAEHRREAGAWYGNHEVRDGRALLVLERDELSRVVALRDDAPAGQVGRPERREGATLGRLGGGGHAAAGGDGQPALPSGEAIDVLQDLVGDGLTEDEHTRRPGRMGLCDDGRRRQHVEPPVQIDQVGADVAAPRRPYELVRPQRG